MPLPDPKPGLVIRYAYLWHDEHIQGREEGRKDRPCAVILSTVREQGETVVTVAPITHTPPRSSVEAVEIPRVTKQRLGLDADQSWVVVSEINRFSWPGPDIRLIDPRKPGEYAYGYLPPRLFTTIKHSLVTLAKALKLKTVHRSE